MPFVSRTIALASAVALAVSGSAVTAQTALATQDPQAEPPTPAVLTQTTKAMLQPGMVPAVLGGPGSQQIGYLIPTGGQDPYPVCFRPGGKTAAADYTLTTGYFSQIGQDTDEVLRQTAIVYPDDAAALAAWNTLVPQIASTCSFTGRGKNKGTTISFGEIPGTGGLWVRSDNASDPAFGEYTAVGLTGDAIVMLTFTNFDGLATQAQGDAVEALWTTLLADFGARTSSTGVQSTLLSIAQAAMVTPADLGPDLPIKSPAQGAWSSFTASLPGTAPLDPCNARLNFFPGGTGSFSADFGDDGGPFLEDGFIWQQAFTFDDADAANAAWRQIQRKLPDCQTTTGTLFAKKKDGSRGVVGTSAISVDGTPGLYYRYLTTMGNNDPQFRWTTRTYQTFFKSGNVISWLTYGISVEGLQQVSIDEGPVNELSVELIDRFVNTVVTTS